MSIKSRISLYISSVFTLFYGSICLFLFYFFADFRREEFQERLAEKAITTIKLLVEVKEVDNHVLKIIDKNSINKLYDEKVLIFDTSYQLIYSSIDDHKVNWSVGELEYLKKHKTFFKKEGNNEIYGYFYDSNSKDYFALVSANDLYGKRKLDFLTNLLLFSFLIFVVFTWVFTYYITKIQLNPLLIFQKQLRVINENNLETPLTVNLKNKSEINLLSIEFNAMMQRISESYKAQKIFTAQASHELRTPIARISARLENHLQDARLDSDTKAIYKSVLADVTVLNEIIHSLLLLSRIEGKKSSYKEKVRIDELMDNSIEKLLSHSPNAKINFNITPIEDIEHKIVVQCNPTLIEIAINNLLINAYQYSTDKVIYTSIFEIENQLAIEIKNRGEKLTDEEQRLMFEPFVRGNNARARHGHGLGLAIVKRIIKAHGFKLNYRLEEQNFHSFTIIFQNKS